MQLNTALTASVPCGKTVLYNLKDGLTTQDLTGVEELL